MLVIILPTSSSPLTLQQRPGSYHVRTAHCSKKNSSPGFPIKGYSLNLPNASWLFWFLGRSSCSNLVSQLSLIMKENKSIGVKKKKTTNLQVCRQMSTLIQNSKKNKTQKPTKTNSILVCTSNNITLGSKRFQLCSKKAQGQMEKISSPD